VFTVDSNNPGFPAQQISTLVSALLSTSNCKVTKKKKIYIEIKINAGLIRDFH